MHPMRRRLGDTAGSSEPRKLEGHTANVLCVAISPDSKSIVSGSSDQTVR